MALSLDIDSLTLLILSCLCPLNSKEEKILGKKAFIIDDRPCIIDLTGRGGPTSECYSLIASSLFHICVK